MILLPLPPVKHVREATSDPDEARGPESFGRPCAAGSLQAAWLSFSKFAGDS